MKTIKLLFLCLLLQVFAFAQQDTTIIWLTPMTRNGVPLVDSNATGPTDYARPNIGQSQHEATLIFSDAPGMTCTGGAIEVFFEGTPDPVNVVNIPKGIAAGATLTYGSTIYARVRADTTLPHIRLNIAAFDTTNCLVSAYYAGSQYPFSFQNFIPEFVLTGLAQLPINAATPGANQLVAASAGGLRICVYEISLWNGVGSQEITVFSDPAATVLDGPFTAFPASAGYSLENAGQVHFCTSNGQSLSLTLSVGTAVTGHVIFRYEP